MRCLRQCKHNVLRVLFFLAIYLTHYHQFYQGRETTTHFISPDDEPSLQIIVAHEPKEDQLGAFLTPTLFLFAIASYHGWKMEILPYTGSKQEKALTRTLALGDKIDRKHGSGLQDSSYREDFNPAKLNADSAEMMGFLPVPEASSSKNWTRVASVPLPGIEIDEACRNHQETEEIGKGKKCYILLPGGPFKMERHMDKLGGRELFFSNEFRESMRTKFLKKNKHRLKHFNGGYNVAVHVRRGDILDGMGRWIDQQVYAKVVRRICKSHPEANIHVFSSGKNLDGNWSTLESLATEEGADGGARCASVSIHLDEHEFDSWTHMITADAFIMSKSSFSLIPAALSGGEVYYPHSFWHFQLSWFHTFHTETGESLS